MKKIKSVEGSQVPDSTDKKVDTDGQADYKYICDVCEREFNITEAIKRGGNMYFCSDECREAFKGGK